MQTIAVHQLRPITASLAMILVACLALSNGLAQEKASENSQSPQPAAEVAQQPNAGDPDYEAAQSALREHLKVMRKLQVEYHMSETPARDKKFRREWAELCDQGRPIAARAYSAMLKKFLSNPPANQELGKFLAELLDRNTRDSCFEGMLELGLALAENGIANENTSKMIALSAVAENKYDVAKPWIERHGSEAKKPMEILGAIYVNIDSLTRDWAEELRLREEDAKGEPLPQVSLLTTKGEIVIELFENQAPETVANFIALVEQDFYNGLQFHRVLEHFMAQTGCPEGDGTGGPGYVIYGEAQKPNARKFFRGSVGLALSQGNVNSGGSQFFMCHLPAYALNNQYTCFGRIVKGLDVLGNLTRVNPEEKKKEDEPPPILDEIIEANVIRKRNHEYKPNKAPLPMQAPQK